MGITHATVATGTDAGTGEIHKAQWNADHVITGENFGFIGCSVYMSADQTVSAAVETTALFDAEYFDTDGFHSTVSDTGKITIPAGLGGKYLVTAFLYLSNAGNYPGNSYMRIRRNGGTDIGFEQHNESGSDLGMHSTAIANLAAGDYLEVKGYRSSGTKFFAGTLISLAKLDSGHVGQGVGARVTKSVSQSPITTQTAVTFDGEDFDSDGFHSISSNTERLTIPAGLSGKYLVHAYLYCTGLAANTNYLHGRITKNGLTPTLSGVRVARSPDDNTILNVMAVVDLVAGDYVLVTVESDDASFTVEAAGTFSIMRLDAMPTPVGVVRNAVLSPSSDTHISSTAATANYDTNTTLTVGNKWGTSDYTRFALFTFDTAALAGKTINSAFLQLVRTDSSALPVTFLQARRILRAYHPTQVTWNEYSSGNNWTTAGAESTGNDVAAGAYGDHQLQNAPGYATNFIRLDVTSLLQEDIDASSTTLRMIVGTTNADGQINALSFASVNNATVAYRPKLFVAYA